MLVLFMRVHAMNFMGKYEDIEDRRTQCLVGSVYPRTSRQCLVGSFK